jgi:hypothetical protein
MEDLGSSAVTGKVLILDNKTGGLTMARIELSAERRDDIRDVWSRPATTGNSRRPPHNE